MDPNIDALVDRLIERQRGLRSLADDLERWARACADQYSDLNDPELAADLRGLAERCRMQADGLFGAREEPQPPCEECAGKGQVLDAPANVLDGRPYWITCEVCHGTGRRTREGPQ
jgi:hypothetical protein